MSEEKVEFAGAWIPVELKRALRIRAALRAATLSDLIREALRGYIEAQPPPTPERLAEVARGGTGREATT